jgi:ABC-type nitrate/sulfonate/bicarbonate transport system permease component
MFLAMVMSLIDIVKETIYPLVIVSQTVPIIALSPLLIIWFGYGILPKVMVVTLVCFFPITVSFFEGLAKVDADTVKVLEAMGASKFQVFRKVQFPAALPALFSGLKISAAYSVMGAVIGEWLGASKGLGIFLTRSMHSFQTEQVFAAIIVISVLSLIFFGLVEITGRLCMPWYYKDYKWQREHSEEQEE